MYFYVYFRPFNQKMSNIISISAVCYTLHICGLSFDWTSSYEIFVPVFHIFEVIFFSVQNLVIKGALNPEIQASSYEKKYTFKPSIIKTQSNLAAKGESVYCSSPYPL